MIKDIQEVRVPTSERHPSPSSCLSFLRLRPRRLSSIEIAEGALLADVGVVFQLLIWFLPIGGSLLQLLVPVIFAVIVLRRGLYVACMSLCVALFIVVIVLGPGGVLLLLLEAGAGLFLGQTMRHRLSYVVTIMIGIVGGALALASISVLLSFLGGGPQALIRGIRVSYEQLLPLIAAIFKLMSLGGFWQSTVLPMLNTFLLWGLQNWFLFLYLASCAVCIPLVLVVYFVTNCLLRLLGYRVRPFPGFRLEGLFYWLILRFLAWMPAKVFTKVPQLYALKREIRRLRRARVHQLRLEKGAK